MKKIAAIVPYRIYPYNSGGQKSLALFYNFFSQKKDLFLICTSNNTKPADAKYTISPVLGNSVYRYINPFLFFKLKNLINKNNIDIIILEHPYFGWLAYLLKRFLKVKVVVHSHNIEGLRFQTLHKGWWKILWQYEKWTHSIADFSFFIQKNDKEYAIQNFHLNPNKTSVITYGITWSKQPDEKERDDAKRRLKELHNIPGNETIILFNGAYDYKPNRDALEAIIYNINPSLLARTDFNYKIIICGRHIPTEILNQTFENVILAGFVEDIELYYKGADTFINPVNDGGGIKTKLVEALGYNITSVSTINSAIGIDEKICNGKLLIVENENYAAFATKVVEAGAVSSSIGKDFYDYFYWGNIIDKALNIIKQL